VWDWTLVMLLGLAALSCVARWLVSGTPCANVIACKHGASLGLANASDVIVNVSDEDDRAICGIAWWSCFIPRCTHAVATLCLERLGLLCDQKQELRVLSIPKVVHS
jgi:hypothetical protein